MSSPPLSSHKRDAAQREDLSSRARKRPSVRDEPAAAASAARGASATAPVYAACAVTHALRLLGAGGVPVRITTRHSYALSREALGVDTVMPKLTPDALEIADVSLEAPTVGSGQVSTTRCRALKSGPGNI